MPGDGFSADLGRMWQKDLKVSEDQDDNGKTTTTVQDVSPYPNMFIFELAMLVYWRVTKGYAEKQGQYRCP